MSRPAPEYGEYATPEEVREALGEHAPPDPARRLDALAPVPGHTPAAASAEGASRAGGGATPRTEATSQPSQGAGATSGSAAPSGAPAKAAPQISTGQRWDQFVTIALILMGLWNTILGTPGMLSFDQAMRSYFAAVEGAPDVTFGEPTRMVGVVMAVLLIGTLIVTAMLAWRRLRAGRLAFWVPLIGAVVSGLIMFGGVTVLLFIEPGLLEGLANAQPR